VLARSKVEPLVPALLEVPRSSQTQQISPVQERILTEAKRLFAERGFERTTVSDICEAAGVTKGALYHYVASKDDVLYAIYYRVLRMQRERLEAIVGSEDPVEARLRAVCADVVVSNIEEFDATRIFLRSMHQLTPDHQQSVRGLRRSYHEVVTALVREGQATNAFRSDISADMIVNYYFGAVHHLAMWYHPDGQLTAHDVGSDFAELLLSSLRVKS
jgi:AcrR family transcriptional regulator